MSAGDLRELGMSDLAKRLEEAREELFNLRLQRASGKLLNPARVVLLRQNLARVLTVLRERAAAGEQPAGGTP